MDNEAEFEDIVVENGFFDKMETLDKFQIDLFVVAIPSVMVIIAEMLLFAGMTKFTIWTHLTLLITLIFSTMIFNDRKQQHIIYAFILLSLLRILNLSMPVFFEIPLYSFVFSYAPLVIPIYILVKDQDLTLSDLGINRNIRYYDLPIALIAGIVIAAVEFLIIRPGYLIPELSLLNLLKLSIVMIFFVGLIEEIIFRSILQTNLEEMVGKYQGLVLASIIFAVMHSVYGSAYEITVAGFAGLILGTMYLLRRNLLLVTLTQGCSNIMLFGILPHTFAPELTTSSIITENGTIISGVILLTLSIVAIGFIKLKRENKSEEKKI
ncbi:CPBP family intramembrane glutamic endopeptidase [Methanococcoides methylutens]|uniref:CAAX amino terminal protease family protein n=1 Tax=Methanococcoides methylutens MM1 TaxID=1434104 RepID=A0A0E3SS20_METMT|nr:type II CAAX endopeptidase family protein [Methanococcoides methylutens]AKB85886.1 CAAX amino terminal protease family protein [Methanococcoides methylutens MM1]